MRAQIATQTGSDSGAVDGYAPPDRRPPLLAYAVTMAVFSALTISDFVQVAYKASEQKGVG
jgi:hypothetical protein